MSSWKIITIFISIGLVLFLSFTYIISADENIPAVILTTNELRKAVQSETSDLTFQFYHSWEHAQRDRMISFDGTGVLIATDFQEAGWIKDGVLSGEISTEEFTESEINVLKRENVDYTILQKGVIEQETVSDIANMVADFGG